MNTIHVRIVLFQALFQAIFSVCVTLFVFLLHFHVLHVIQTTTHTFTTSWSTTAVNEREKKQSPEEKEAMENTYIITCKSFLGIDITDTLVNHFIYHFKSVEWWRFPRFDVISYPLHFFHLFFYILFFLVCFFLSCFLFVVLHHANHNILFIVPVVPLTTTVHIQSETNVQLFDTTASVA